MRIPTEQLNRCLGSHPGSLQRGTYSTVSAVGSIPLSVLGVVFHQEGELKHGIPNLLNSMAPDLKTLEKDKADCDVNRDSQLKPKSSGLERWLGS